jgi:hypothetical protein
MDLDVPAGNPLAPANSVGMSARPRAEAGWSVSFDWEKEQDITIEKYAIEAVTVR